MFVKVLVTAVLLLTPTPVFAQAPVDRISGPPVCNTCRIERSLAATLSDSLNPGVMGQNSIVSNRADGQFFVASGANLNELYLFSRQGTPLRRIGGPGRGPGEYRWLLEVTEVSEGYAVVDYGQRRVTYLSPDLRVIETAIIPGSNFMSFGFWLNGSYAMSADVRTPASIGKALHVVNRDGTISRSFDEIPGIFTPARARELQRLVVAGPNGTLWSARYSAYRLEQWDSAGRLLRTIQRDLPEMPGQPRNQTQPSSGPASSTIIKLSETADSLMWVFIVRGGTAAALVVEVLDIQRGSVLASTEFPGDSFSPVSGRSPSVATYREARDGSPLMDVWQFRLTR